MSNQTYTYSLTTHFSGNLNTTQLFWEIDQEEAITANCLTVSNTGDSVRIVFDSALSAQEQSELNILVTNHVPMTDVDQGNYGEALSLSATTSETYLQKLRLTYSTVSTGDYFIRWSLSAGNSDIEKPTLIRIQLDDTTTLTECGVVIENDLIPKKSISGFRRVNLTPGTHNVDVDYCTTADGGAAQIEDVCLWISHESN